MAVIRFFDDISPNAYLALPARRDELFCGCDDFPQLELFLAGRDPLDPSAWQKWSAASRPSAVRRKTPRVD